MVDISTIFFGMVSVFGAIALFCIIINFINTDIQDLEKEKQCVSDCNFFGGELYKYNHLTRYKTEECWCMIEGGTKRIW